MKKFVVISVNEVKKYQVFIPLVVWCWRHFHWNVLLLYQGNESPTMDLIGTTTKYLKMGDSLAVAYINPLKGYESATVAQASRLYAACLYLNGAFAADDYFLTSDADLIPLSDYWRPTVFTPTAWGRDLTDYHYPIGYCGATAFHWNQFMKPQSHAIDFSMLKDFERLPASNWRKKEDVWTSDQTILTNKLLIYGKQNIVHIDRGTDPKTGYPIGRVDRSSWHLNHENFIDCHAPHDILHNDFSLVKVMDLLRLRWPLEDWTWFESYVKEFKKL